MLSVASEAKDYQLIIPEMVYYFERLIADWYGEEARYVEWIPRPNDIFEEEVSNFTQHFLDTFAESQGILDGEMVNGELPDGVWEVLMMDISENFDWWYPRMFGDICMFLENHHFFYNASEYTGDQRIVGDFRNVPLQEVW